MYSRRYYSRDRELDIDIERAGLRLALLNNTTSSVYPSYPFYTLYNYLPSYSYPYYGVLPQYFNGYPYVSRYPYLYY